MEYDVGHCLSEFISSIDNLPAELSYHLAELKSKEIKYQDVRRAIIKRDSLLASYIKEHNLQNSQQYESIMNTKTRRDFAQARQLADEKITLSEQTLELLERHIKRLDIDLGRLTSEIHGDLADYSLSRRENHGYIEAEDLDPTGLGGQTIPRSRLKGRQKKSQKTVLRGDHVIVRNDDEVRTADNIAVDGGEVDDTIYCFCRQVSFGDMVACDGKDCTYEWFHWECVGLTEEPVGAWYCSECLENRKRLEFS